MTTMTRPFPGVLNLSTPARRATAVVAVGTAAFWAVAFVFTYVTTQLRYEAITEAMPRMQAAYERWNTSPQETLTWGSVATPASEQLGAIAGHVTSLSVVFAAVLAVIAVLVVHRRTGFAALAAVSAAFGVVLGAGPLSLVAGTIEQTAVSVNGLQTVTGVPTANAQAFVDYQNAMVAFAAPSWWYAAVGIGVAVVLAVALLALRRFAGPDDDVVVVPAVVTTSVLAVFVVVTALAGMNDVIADEGNAYTGTALAGLLVTYLGIGTAAAIAGTCLARGARSFAPALALTAFIALAVVVTWSTHHVSGGADHAFGYVDMGSDPPPISLPAFAAALVVAVPFGWGTALLAAAVRHRAAGTATLSPAA